MLDRLQRPLRDLRVSVTDRCNLRCPYCMPREVFGTRFRFLPREQLLTFEEITRVVRAAAAHGVAKVRLTGGEPLLRRELERLLEMLARVDGVSDLAMTTNGLLLARHAQRLRDAGLRRVTVSLDALEQDTLRAMSDGPVSPARILDAIEVASGVGLSPVKINMVVRRGVNDHCVADMAARFRHRPEIVRFIEYMDVGSTNGWSAQEVVSASEILKVIGRAGRSSRWSRSARARWPPVIATAMAPARSASSIPSAPRSAAAAAAPACRPTGSCSPACSPGRGTTCAACCAAAPAQASSSGGCTRSGAGVRTATRPSAPALGRPLSSSRPRSRCPTSGAERRPGAGHPPLTTGGPEPSLIVSSSTAETITSTAESARAAGKSEANWS